tara:strand:- start:268 stop:669 length:402 start_codon:yes stop_codon:yes gene_type:complete
MAIEFKINMNMEPGLALGIGHKFYNLTWPKLSYRIIGQRKNYVQIEQNPEIIRTQEIDYPFKEPQINKALSELIRDWSIGRSIEKEIPIALRKESGNLEKVFMFERTESVPGFPNLTREAKVTYKGEQEIIED